MAVTSSPILRQLDKAPGVSFTISRDTIFEGDCAFGPSKNTPDGPGRGGGG